MKIVLCLVSPKHVKKPENLKAQNLIKPVRKNLAQIQSEPDMARAQNRPIYSCFRFLVYTQLKARLIGPTQSLFIWANLNSSPI